MEYKIKNTKISIDTISKYLGIKKDTITAKPKMVSIYKDTELIISVSDLSVLKDLKPNINKYSKLCKQLGVTGISIFTNQTFIKNNSLHTREFAPLYGYLEDPLCGLAAGAIAKYLQSSGVKGKLKIEQGNFIKSPGLIEVLPSKFGFYIGGNYVIKSKTWKV